MGLFAPAWTTDNPKKLDKAIAAVGKINDSNQLYEIATTAPIDEVRKAAIGRITDQAMLAKIVEQSESFSVANAALERLSDPAQLKQIALKGHTECSGSDLFEKITDQTALYEIATRSDDLNMRLRAIDGLDDADTLLSLMAGAPSAKEREKAREQVEELYIDHCGIGGLFAKHKDDELTDEQFRRYLYRWVEKNADDEDVLPGESIGDWMQGEWIQPEEQQMSARLQRSPYHLFLSPWWRSFWSL